MKIVIVGGGTAGWITAAFLVKYTNFRDITLIESSNIPIIGAGEGSTGSLPWFVNGDPWQNDLVNEIDFLRKTKGTPKIGITLKNWKGDGTTYYSPLSTTRTRLNRIDTAFLGTILKDGNGNHASLGSYLLENKLSPILKRNGKTISDTIPYSYHFDGNEAGKYFKNICLKFGVNVIDSEVSDCSFDENGYITKLNLTNHSELSADLFFDCSGFSRVLVKKLKNDWISFKNNLPTNSAIPFSREINSKVVNFETLAETMKSGWFWQIPLQYRYGCGYVYSDDFQTFDECVIEMEKHLGQKIEPIKNIKFEAGRYDKIWNKNVVAIGLSSHFLEPLQATSIHIAINTLTIFILHFLKTKNSIYSETNLNNFNKLINSTIDDYRDLLQMHYLMGRQDTPFWKLAKNELTITEKNKELFELAKYRIPNTLDFNQNHGAVGWGLWTHMLDNVGLFDKNLIVEELKNYNKEAEALLEANNVKNNFDKIKNDLISASEYFKYLKI
jgi:flavin-dependent dehydrogenase